MDDRMISFERIGNARDMGGLHTAQGRILSSGLLIRSANLSDATETDKTVLREKYRLAKIIDLRTEIERKEMPDASIAAVEYRPIPIFDNAVAESLTRSGAAANSFLRVFQRWDSCIAKW